MAWRIQPPDLSQDKATYWQSVLENWKSSCLSINKFCQTYNLKVNQFRYWQQRLTDTSKQQKMNPTDSDLTFTPVNVELVTASNPAAPSVPLELITPKGYCLKIFSDFDEKSLTQVLRILGAKE